MAFQFYHTHCYGYFIYGSEIFHFCTISLLIIDFPFLIWLQTLLYIYKYNIDWILINIIAIILESTSCFIESKANLFSEDNNFLGGNDLIIEENEFFVLFTVSCRFVHWFTNLTFVTGELQTSSCSALNISKNI